MWVVDGRIVIEKAINFKILCFIFLSIALIVRCYHNEGVDLFRGSVLLL